MTLPLSLTISVLPLICGFHDPRAAQDPIGAMDQAYIHESKTAHFDDDLDRQRFYERWLQAFRQALQEHPDSAYVRTARSRTIELLNGLGRYRESIVALQEEYDAAGSDRSRAETLYHVGELAYKLGMSGDVEMARKSINSFTQVRALVKEPNEWWVIGLCKSASLQSLVFSAHLEAAENYAKAYEIMPGLTPARRENLSSQQYYQEELPQRMAVEYAWAGRAEESIAALKRLDQLEDRHFSMVHHLRALLHSPKDRPQVPAAVVDYAAAWLEAHPNSQDAAQLGIDIARAYTDNGNRERSIEWYENVLRYAEDGEAGIGTRNAADLAASSLQGLYYQTGQTKKLEALKGRTISGRD